MRSTRDDVDPELHEHLLMAKAALLRGPRPEVASAHIAAVTEAAHLLARGSDARPTAAPAGARGPRERVRAKMRRVAVGVAVAAMAGVVSMAGLAFASGTLPVTAVTAMAKHGLSLPTQTTASHSSSQHSSSGSLPDASQHGQDVKGVATDGTTGCRHGQEVTAVGSSNRQDSHAAPRRQDAANRPDPCAQGGSASSGATGGAPSSGQDNHPTGSPPTTPGTNPTGGTSGRATNPTGYGKNTHPTDGATGQATNPTGYVQDTHPAP